MTSETKKELNRELQNRANRAASFAYWYTYQVRDIEMGAQFVALAEALWQEVYALNA